MDSERIGDGDRSADAPRTGASADDTAAADGVGVVDGVEEAGGGEEMPLNPDVADLLDELEELRRTLDDPEEPRTAIPDAADGPPHPGQRDVRADHR
jgi:hypothetical protein